MFFWLLLFSFALLIPVAIFFVVIFNRKKTGWIDKHLKEIIKILQPHFDQQLVIAERSDDRPGSFSASYRGVYLVNNGVYNFLVGLKLEWANRKLVKVIPCSSLEDGHKREIDYIFRKLETL